MHKPAVTVTIYLFQDKGRWGHWVRVEGRLSARCALRLAVAALRERIKRKIW